MNHHKPKEEVVKPSAEKWSALSLRPHLICSVSLRLSHTRTGKGKAISRFIYFLRCVNVNLRLYSQGLANMVTGIIMYSKLCLKAHSAKPSVLNLIAI